MSSSDEMIAALRRYWGYDSFRPLQERIVSSLLAHRDTCVVMPTGGGKSLCYQLPAALLADKTVIVVVEDLMKHPKYGKVMRRKSRYVAHDEEDACGIGDRVVLAETRPLSATKRWRVARIVEKAK